MNKILEQLAKENDLPVTEVQRDMQATIDALWNHPELDTEEFRILRWIYRF